MSRPARRLLAAVLCLGFGIGLVTCAPRPAAQAWHAVELSASAEFEGLWFTDPRNGWLAGGGFFLDGGLVGRTRDGGLTWTFSNPRPPSLGTSPRRFMLCRLQFLDSLRGLAASDHGVYLTDDGGGLWRRALPGGSRADPLLDLQLLDGRHGWAVGGGGLLETEDGGENWRLIGERKPYEGCVAGTALCFTRPHRGFLVGMHGLAKRTDDGGRTWTRFALEFDEGAQPRLYDVSFVDSQHGWITGENAHLFVTRDGGESWARQRNGIPVTRPADLRDPPRPRDVLPELEAEPSKLCLSAVQFVDPARGWAVGFYPSEGVSVVLGTRDGGETWAIERSIAGEELRAVFALDSTHAWAIGDRIREGKQQLLLYRPATP